MTSPLATHVASSTAYVALVAITGGMMLSSAGMLPRMDLSNSNLKAESQPTDVPVRERPAEPRSPGVDGVQVVPALLPQTPAAPICRSDGGCISFEVLITEKLADLPVFVGIGSAGILPQAADARVLPVDQVIGADEVDLAPPVGGVATMGTPDTTPATPDPGPVDPGPVDPGPVDPGPVDPGPVDPGPVDPGPVDPDPVDPDPVVPVDPDPVDPNRVDPSEVDPSHVAPGHVEPGPADPGPADPGGPSAP